MSLSRPTVLLPLVLALLAGCDPSPPSGGSTTGSMRLAVSTPLASPGDVSRVTVIVTASDMDSLSTDLVLTDGTWSGVLGDIPAGAHRTFQAQAFDSFNTLRYLGSAEDVTVTAGSTGLVSLTLQNVSPPPPLTNEAPLIDSLVADLTTVLPGGSISLSVSARDPDVGDTLSFAWTAPAGSFSAPTQASTTWTAPSTHGPVTLSLSVSDSRGASLSVSLTVNVSTNSGAAEVRVGFNTAPRLETLSSSQSFLEVGQQTALSISATDVDGDTLSYQWSSTCVGSFTGADTTSATFTPSALPTATCNNCQLSVTVKDGRGGQNTGRVALCVSTAPVWRAPPKWLLTGTMATPRDHHTATLLHDGKVLVMGGGGIRTTELYDPATGTWSPTGAMIAQRSMYAMTLLHDGKVLVTGGLAGSTPVGAEVYDPATGSWRTTGAMSSARTQHTATLLSNGKVLVTGGNRDSTYLKTAELYDPATDTWSPTGSMSSTRYLHTATLLPNGKVLVSAGHNETGNVTTAEVYDPATGTWSPTGSPKVWRTWHTATLLSNGKVLYAGGDSVTAEVYDPATGTWRLTGAMTASRSWHTATLLPNGKVLVTGGFDGGNLATAEVYDPATGAWSSTSAMTAPRYWHTATLLSNGKVLVTGGRSGSVTLKTAEVYDPAPGS